MGLFGPTFFVFFAENVPLATTFAVKPLTRGIHPATIIA
jgi:hypothetical protein